MRCAGVVVFLAATVFAGPTERLPAGCCVAIHVDFAALRKSEVWTRIAKPINELLGEGLGLEGLFEQTKFRPDRDLDSITAALDLSSNEDEQRHYVIARGRFDAAAFAACMKDAGMEPVRRDGMKVFPSDDARTAKDARMAFGILDGGEALLFAEPGSGLDGLRAATGAEAPQQELSKRLAAAPAGHAWTVYLPSPALRETMRKEPEGESWAALTSLVVTYKIGPTVEAACAATAESEEAAKRLLEVAQACLPRLGGLDKYAKLTRHGAALNARIAIPLEEAMALAGMPIEPAGKPGASTPVVIPGAPGIEGKGRLRRLALRGQVNSLAVSPDDRHVFVDRALDSDVVLDADLRIVGKEREAGGRVAFAPDGKTVLRYQLGAEIRSIPGLEVIRWIEDPASGRMDTVWSICALPDARGFVLVDWDAIRVLRTDPPGWGEVSKSALDHPIAGAIDAATGLLVMIGDKMRLELFDLGAMKSVATLDLPHSVTYDVVAAGGRAFVGTRDGVILPVDIRARRVLEPIRVADGEVSLALAGSGRGLLAVADKFVDGHHHPTTIVAYTLADGALSPVARTSFMAPGPFNDVAFLQSRRMALLGGDESFVWQYGPVKDD